ncbi:enoyl-CoA hydratase-related protein [Streptomyces sp. NPDC008150]|uniref:enoyl-CoA hydratase/isomerase family protein n=1 Tax=Streptomyces sp. NPDC008150 TaxID=3364816 RepID=UPI0036E81996
MTILPTGIPAFRTMPKTLRCVQQGPVLHVELNRPDEGNAVTDDVLDELHEVLRTQDPSVRVLVLSGAGEDFCLGGDRSEFGDHLAHDSSGAGIRASGVRARQVCDALSNNPAVTVARVQGRAVGAGFALALACDLRVGAENASFRLPELALGLPVAWGGLLPRLINEVGPARVREIVLSGRAVEAREAFDLSILQRIVPAGELDEAVAAWVRPVLRRPAAAVRVTRTLLQAYGSAARQGDLSFLDAELMSGVLSQAHLAARER